MKPLIWITFLTISVNSCGQITHIQKMKYKDISDAVILLPKGQESYFNFFKEKRLSKKQLFSVDSLIIIFNTIKNYSFDPNKLKNFKDSVNEKYYQLVEENILVSNLISSLNEIFTQLVFLDQDFTKDFINASLNTKDMNIKIYCSESLNRFWTLIITNRNGIESILQINALSPNIGYMSSGFLNLRNKIDNTNVTSFLKESSFDISLSEKNANMYLKKIQSGIANSKELLLLCNNYTKNLSAIYENNYKIIVENIPLKYLQLLQIN
jgi:hypothetical protein